MKPIISLLKGLISKANSFNRHIFAKNFLPKTEVYALAVELIVILLL